MKNTRIITFLCFIFLMASCSKELELNPFQSLSTGEALADLASMRTAVNGAYDAMQSVGYYGREYLVMPETEANLVYLSIANSNRFIPSYTYQWTTADGDITDVWNIGYSTILRANNVINNIDPLEGDAAEKNQIKGEALAIRAMVHFDLVRFFAKQYTNGNPSTDLGVPIILESGIGEPARNTVEEVYNQVIADLTAAKGLLRDEGIHRFSPNAAEALLARVYLYKGDWANAATAATNVIGAGYTLADDVVAMFAGPGSSEEIFTLKNESSENRGSDNLGNIYIPAGYGDIRVTTDLMDLYEPGDSRANFIFKHTNNEFYQSKFSEQDGVVGLASPKLLRLAEMYLIRAEARFRQNAADPGVLSDLNAIRLKRGATQMMSLPNGIGDILAERHRELAFEGHTAFDYWRTGTKMVRQQCDTGLEVSGVCEIEANDFRTVHPIPQREIDVNQSMVQNGGY
ncbi:MAG: RagB/SusD family nutrient uptake outer membrane protein [Lewinellaceae bacterium]|nr:RagB/SusD family nutrient uptake outer membrane protein [Saprospiraceae bacterium]MCB9331360.1 RagB/SusD family nutrient uptake outer membrane protein [Lewinellaceae bacterium]